jgi:hypothetical protein
MSGWSVNNHFSPFLTFFTFLPDFEAAGWKDRSSSVLSSNHLTITKSCSLLIFPLHELSITFWWHDQFPKKFNANSLF